MNALARWSIVCMGLGLVSCAGLGKFSFGPSDPRCEKLATLPINLEEEKAFGGTMAVELARRTGGVFLDVQERLEVIEPQLKLPPQQRTAPKPGKTPANDLTRYLNVVGRGLASRSARPTLDWKFGVLNSDQINAFSAPGGYVLVTKGLLRKIDNEAQLAGVLAHEIAHVTEQHALDTYRKVKSGQCTLAVAGNSPVAKAVVRELLGAFLGNLLGAMPLPEGADLAFQQLITSSDPTGFLNLDKEENFKALEGLVQPVVEVIVTHGLDKEKEFDADRVGLELVVSAGYNPNEYVQFLAKLGESKELLSTHPPTQERQAKLGTWLESAAKSDLYEGGPAFSTYPVVPLKNELAAAAAK